MGLQMGSLGRWGGHLGGCRTNQHSCIFMRQWVKAAYLTRASVTRTHEYAFRKTSCDSLLGEHGFECSLVGSEEGYGGGDRFE
jgi:hypothetical protein